MTFFSPTKPLSAVASAIRLSLSPVMDRPAAVAGAWWPCSRDAAAELPGLIAAVDQRLGRTTLRVGVSREAWDHISRRIPAGERQVRVDWFRSTDPRVITLSLSGGEPITLLVIPSATASGPAEAALRLASQDTTGLGPADILSIAHLPAAPRKSEGGHILGRAPAGSIR